MQNDSGALLAHRAFWELAPRGEEIDMTHLSQRTITDLVYVSDDVEDGIFLLQLGTAPLCMDAAPARHCLYPLLAIQ